MLNYKVVYEMFGKKVVLQSEKTVDRIDGLREKLDQAEVVIIGAGAGLSTSAGFTYIGKRFFKYFQDFIDQYGFQDMYSGGFYPFETLEEHWAYWSRYIYINRYQSAPRPVYHQLLESVKEKNYFVLTTNVDHQFQKAGFQKQRLFYTQGDYGLFQCSEPCHLKTYDNEEVIYQMMEQQKDMRIPSELIPYCPVCGKAMSMNLRADHTFVEDEGWHQAAIRYDKFLQKHQNKKTLFLELGTGMNTPSIIKFNFWKMVYQWREAGYVCINLGEAFVPNEIREKSICIHEDIGKVLKQL